MPECFFQQALDYAAYVYTFNRTSSPPLPLPPTRLFGPPETETVFFPFANGSERLFFFPLSVPAARALILTKWGCNTKRMLRPATAAVNRPAAGRQETHTRSRCRPSWLPNGPVLYSFTIQSSEKSPDMQTAYRVHDAAYT